MSKNIVWLASYPKSGNTWIRAIVYAALFGQLNINELGKLIPSFAFAASLLNDKKFLIFLKLVNENLQDEHPNYTHQAMNISHYNTLLIKVLKPEKTLSFFLR